jgi:hypothetical protein
MAAEEAAELREQSESISASVAVREVIRGVACGEFGIGSGFHKGTAVWWDSCWRWIDPDGEDGAGRVYSFTELQAL